jgi:hypothetical protein
MGEITVSFALLIGFSAGFAVCFVVAFMAKTKFDKQTAGVMAALVRYECEIDRLHFRLSMAQDDYISVALKQHDEKLTLLDVKLTEAYEQGKADSDAGK